MKIFFYSLLVVHLAGCAVATGPKFSSFEDLSPNTAEIYIIRTEDGTMGSRIGAMPPITVDGKEIGILKREGYIKTKVHPGRHIVSTVPNFMTNWDLAQSVVLQTTGGKRYFVRLHSNSGGTQLRGSMIVKNVVFSFREATEQEALPFLPTLSLSE
ncbi:MAG TPA: DUF2846 domain-containing protein [Dehalococcoidia bacterium]|nr:DUF2846 domain-containing protein [Dehalococcoidia bacterium]